MDEPGEVEAPDEANIPIYVQEDVHGADGLDRGVAGDAWGYVWVLSRPSP